MVNVGDIVKIPSQWNAETDNQYEVKRVVPLIGGAWFVEVIPVGGSLPFWIKVRKG